MKEIFKSIIGMMIIITLFLALETVVQLFVPQLNPLVSILKGFAIVTMILGIIIISKSVFDLTLKRNP